LNDLKSERSERLNGARLPLKTLGNKDRRSRHKLDSG
jgi:hypothetical protein